MIIIRNFKIKGEKLTLTTVELVKLNQEYSSMEPSNFIVEVPHPKKRNNITNCFAFGFRIIVGFGWGKPIGAFTAWNGEIMITNDRLTHNFPLGG
jgi:hypothetical protein